MKSLFSLLQVIILLMTILSQTLQVQGSPFTIPGQPGPAVLTGTVTDGSTGNPIPGVNVFIEGTTQGTITDIEGRYRLEFIREEETRIVFSFVGYLGKVVGYSGQEIMDISLEMEAKDLDEVVVIGYGTQRAEDLTGSVSVVSASDMIKSNAPTIEAALQGRAPGVLVSSTGGRPGSGFSVKIRGLGSINSSTDPLYIVDGLPVGGLSGFNPEDIESVQVLKDASATAIYGARGANGVVIITTRRGKTNQPVRVDFSSYYKIADFPVSRRYDVMNTSEYVELTNTAYELTEPGTQPLIISSDSLRQAYGDTDTDWQEELMRTGFGQNYYLGLSGGNEFANYNVSGNYYSEEGVMINTDFERINLRANSDYRLFNDRLKIGESILISRTRDHGSTGGQGNKWVMATLVTPIMPVYEPKNMGGFAGPTDSINGRNEQTNPVGEQLLRNEDVTNTRVLSNLYGELRLLEGLSYKVNIGLSYGSARVTRWIPEYELGNIGNRSNAVSSLYEQGTDYRQFLLENLLTFDRSIREHNFTLVAGHVYQKDYSDMFGATGQEFRDMSKHTLAQAEIASSLNSYISEHIIDSYLARLIYDYKSRYLLTASIRRDGSSRFGPEGERYGNFPSFSLGWKMNEDLLRNVDQISMLKLRFGWGHTGNMNIGNYVYDTYLLRPDASRYLFGEDETVYLGATDLRSTGNPEIQWEHSITTNIGMDLSAFRNKLEMSVEYYIKNQDKMLTTIELPMLHGKDWDDPNSNPWYNLGDVQNKGFEMNILHRNTHGKFSYSLGGNITTIKNKVVSLPNSTPIFTDYTITTEGHTIGSFFGYVADGIFQSQEEVDNHAEQDAVPGDIRFKDINQDGRITSLDRVIIGKPLPDFTYGLTLDLGYRNFDMVVYLYGMQNLDVYNQHYSFIGLATDRESKDFNKLRSVSNYWTETNPVSDQTRLSTKDTNYNARISSWFTEDASFLRIQSLQLGYQLPERLSARLNLENLRFYVNVQNLHVFTKYRGYDPEVGSNNVLRMGVDEGYYPIPRSFIVGIQVTI